MINLTKINDWIWEIPKSYRSDMRVPARVYVSEKMLAGISRDRSLEQLVNVATLPGIQKYALAMPDVHEGYGFPVGGVAAFDAQTGVISPGGIGYDINCGVRLLRSDLTRDEITSGLGKLATAIYEEVPSGVGRGGRLKLSEKLFDEVLESGAKRAAEMGYGNTKDLENAKKGDVVVLGRVGKKNKLEIAKRAGSMGIVFQNINIKKFLKTEGKNESK